MVLATHRQEIANPVLVLYTELDLEVIPKKLFLEHTLNLTPLSLQGNLRLPHIDSCPSAVPSKLSLSCGWEKRHKAK